MGTVCMHAHGIVDHSGVSQYGKSTSGDFQREPHRIGAIMARWKCSDIEYSDLERLLGREGSHQRCWDSQFFQFQWVLFNQLPVHIHGFSGLPCEYSCSPTMVGMQVGYAQSLDLIEIEGSLLCSPTQLAQGEPSLEQDCRLFVGKQIPVAR